MNIRTTARHFAELNAPSSELMDKTLYLMRGAQQDGQEKARRHPALRRLGVAASAMAAVMVLLVGTNLAFPAFAEGLPLVGSIFQYINDKGRFPTENLSAARSSISAYAVDVSEEPGSTVTVPGENPFERTVTAQLKEIYYDGGFVFAGLEFQVKADAEQLKAYCDVFLNGELQKEENADGFFDSSDFSLTKLTDGRYVTQKAFRVPDALQGAGNVQVDLRFGGIYDYNGGISAINNPAGFTLSFTAQKQDVPTKVISCDGIEMNGVRLVSAAANPVVTYLHIEYPETYVNPACWAGFDDGISIGYFGAGKPLSENGVVRDMGALAGLREDETRSVVWRLFDKNGSGKAEAIFVIDFANGTVRLGSEEDLKRPPVGDYACGVEAIQNLQDGYIVEKYHAEQSKPMLYLANGSGKREDLWIELWQDGVQIDSTAVPRNATGWSDSYPYWEYGEDGDIPDTDERDPSTGHTVCMIILHNGYAGLDLAHPLTVKAYNAARELVLDQEITLTVHEG